MNPERLHGIKKAGNALSSGKQNLLRRQMYLLAGPYCSLYLIFLA